jgi:long-chain acyl-CoA synthetase
MNPLLKAREVAYYLGDSGARLLFVWHGFADEASAGAKRAEAEAVVVDPASFAEVLASAEPDMEVADRQEGDTAVILYTSGTTGQPKGAELTHANLARNTEVGRTDLFRLTAEDVSFGGLPLFHSFGQTCTLNAAVASGASLSLLPRFDPVGALQTLAGHRATVFMVVPTMYTALLHCPDRAAYDVSALRLAVSGGAAMPVEVLRGFEEAFGCPVLEGYGLSETSPLASFNHPDRQQKPGTIGTPIRGVEMRVVDEQGAELPQGQVGEIAIRGHNVMKGYWRRPEDTARAIPDGWFRTGDVGRVDEDRYFATVDRKKDLIIRGGFNVYPREVEEVLYEHPAVAALALAVTVLDNARAGTPAALADRRLAAAATAMSRRRGYLDGRALAEVFAWLRPEDLIWNYWVNNYLLGQKPPAFDILFWNADTTRMSAGLHADFVDLAMENHLVMPGEMTVLGQPIDLSRIEVDAYVVAGMADHLTPWQNCYRSTQLLGGDSRFVLSTSGHIAAPVDPPGTRGPATRPTRTIRPMRSSGCGPRRRSRGAGGPTWWPGSATAAAPRGGRRSSSAAGGCAHWSRRPAPMSSTAEGTGSCTRASVDPWARTTSGSPTSSPARSATTCGAPATSSTTGCCRSSTATGSAPSFPGR